MLPRVREPQICDISGGGVTVIASFSNVQSRCNALPEKGLSSSEFFCKKLRKRGQREECSKYYRKKRKRRAGRLRLGVEIPSQCRDYLILQSSTLANPILPAPLPTNVTFCPLLILEAPDSSSRAQCTHPMSSSPLRLT